MIENRKCQIDTSFAICSVCDEENDCGSGWSLNGKPPFKWACTECQDNMPHAMTITFKERSQYDRAARDYGGAKAGEYLESIGKTDLADLEEHEWARFLDTFSRAKASELRRLLAPTCPPF